jgi:phosphoglucosamine mutase
MERLFGTDGIRAVAGQFPLDYSSVVSLGKTLIDLLIKEGLSPNVLVGSDTRESRSWLQDALFQGIREASGEAVSLGVIPTSAVSYLTKTQNFAAGAVISASHNPYQDNGIKIFSSEGVKISDSWEEKLEQGVRSPQKNSTREVATITPARELIEVYKNYLKSQFDGIRIHRPLKVVLDCANGASSTCAPEILSGLGFDVYPINAAPDGKNINAGCGSLHPEILAQTVRSTAADIGVAYDGDADRAIWVDEKGNILTGDHTLYVCAKFMKDTGRLKSDTVVATTMSNIGLETALKKIRLNLYRTQVGDKYVREHMDKLNANLGGEQSGHTIFLDDFPTGDGILTSLKMLEALVSNNTSLSELVSDYKECPQILLNVSVTKKEDFNLFPEIVDTITQIKNRLGNEGRINVRYSGTEPLARVMIEGLDKKQIQTDAENMAAVISKFLGKYT